MPATLADVARHAGVSVSTASRVLNGSARTVNSELQLRVQAAARDLRYVPNAHAQALVRERSAIVGVMVHDVSDPYFAEITRGIQRSASAARRLVLVCNSYRDPERELEYMRLLHAQRVEAIILAGSGLEDDPYCEAMNAEIDAFTATGGRVAVIGRHCLSGNTVLPDNVGGARIVARHLFELGHREIGVIDGPTLVTSTHDRRTSFCDELQTLGVCVPTNQIVPGDFSRDGGMRATNELLDAHPQITAIFALNDVMAIGALTALRQRGVAVPKQVSVVGFDNIPIAADVTPALTTVHVPMVELGITAFDLIIATHDVPPITHLPIQLVVRDSTAPPPDR